MNHTRAFCLVISRDSESSPEYPWQSFALRCGQVLEEVRDCRVGQIFEFAGIEIGSVTGTTGLVPDVGLLWVDDSDHGSAASRALVVVHGVGLFAYFFITDVDCFGGLFVFQDVDLSGVEPDAVADGATIDFGAFICDLFHVGSAFGAAHSA